MEAFDHLVATETRLWNLLESTLRREQRAGLGTLQALRAIARHHPEARVDDVRRDLIITNGAASKIVDRMTAAGLVTRSPHPTDRRSSLLTLTPAGEAELRASEAVLCRLTATLIDPDTATALIGALADIDARLSDFTQETP